MRIATIRSEDIVNGPGIRTSIYVQGCPHHCPECFNPETWTFEAGHSWTPKVKQQFLKLGNQKHIAGFSILGGEPLAQADDMLDLVKSIHNIPKKTIWMWTGYVWEELTEYQKSIVKYVDVLVDGRFDRDKKCPGKRFRGSLNQRIIDVKQTLKEGHIVLSDFQN